MSALCLGYKIDFCKNKQTNKQTNKSTQGRKEASMTARWTRGGGNEAQDRKEKMNTMKDLNYF